MKKFMILLMILLLAPSVFASISLTADQSVYNLGDRVRASSSITQNESFEGLFKMYIVCGTYKLQYFLTPISLGKDFVTAANVPEVAATQQMLGSCKVSAELSTNDNLLIEQEDSNVITITDELSLLPIKQDITALPLASLLINGVVNGASGNNVLKAATKVKLDNDSYDIEAIDGKFEMTLSLGQHIKSGKHTIGISVADSKGNSGDSAINLTVTPVPTYIKNKLSSSEIQPGTVVGLTASLYDQADDVINSTLELELTSPKGNNVFKRSIGSGSELPYEFSQYAEPGAYRLKSTFMHLSEESIINVKEVKEVRVKYENETVLVENLGNLPFQDELTFILQTGLKKIPITKKLSIEPGKSLIVDLSKEVPQGIYDVVMPLKEGISALAHNISENLHDVFGQSPESVLANGVEIHDNRPLYKRLASGVSDITGNLVGAQGMLADNPVIAPAIILIIIAVIVFRYGKKPITILFRRKESSREEEKERKKEDERNF